MKKLGVVVARFQVPSLHIGHAHLLNEAAQGSDILLVILGHKINQPDIKNPLSLKVRQAMVRQVLASSGSGKQFLLGDVEDSPVSNEAWSIALDKHIQEHVDNLESDHNEKIEVCLYGSRDSFIKYYHGNYAHATIGEIEAVSGTEVRKKILSLTEDELTNEQREGMVYAFRDIYPVGMSVVDVLLYKKEAGVTSVLLGRKKREVSYRLIGGFFDVASDESLEDAALRELREEVGDVATKNLQYVTSKKVDDWRYRDNQHKIVSALFVTEYISGEVTPQDDIEEVKWFSIDEALTSVQHSHKDFLMKGVEQIV
jgi:bifunctional NMN adenylyltransferase/nudix hydrolase